MSQPKVSIVIPVYNVERYLRECLDSVCRQTLSDIEIICVNDGSTDGSLTIIREYAAKDPRFVVLDGPNGGYGKAMNRGISAATGEYVGIVEPDDFIALSMYEDLYEAASKNALDLIKGDFYRFKRDESGNMEMRYVSLDPTGRWYGKVFDPSNDPEALRLAMNTWAGIYRREFLEENGISHHETPGASFQDNGFWIQTFVFARRAMILNKPYYLNRRDNPNSSVNDPSKVYCMCDEYDYIEALLRPHEELWDKFAPMIWFRRYGNYRFTMDRIGREAMNGYMLRFQSDFKRAEQLGELDANIFDSRQWTALKAIMDSPEKFGKKFVRRRSFGTFLHNRAVSLKKHLPRV